MINGATAINPSNLITYADLKVGITCEPGSGGFGFICSGSTILYNNKRYVCINSHYPFEDSWNPESCPSLWMPVSSETSESSKTDKPKITNCKNCGAPLHGSICEYCGTEY